MTPNDKTMITLKRLPISWCSERFRHSFDCIFTLRNVHNRYTWNLADAASQVLITSRDNKTTVLFHHLNNIVIRIMTLFQIAWHTKKARILCQAKSNSVLCAELFQLRHDAIQNNWDALCVKAIHHRLDYVQLVPNGKVDKIGINNDVVSVF